MKCTNRKCGKEIKDVRISVELSVVVERKTESGAWEKVANAGIKSGEILCQDCFDNFVDALDAAMN